MHLTDRDSKLYLRAGMRAPRDGWYHPIHYRVTVVLMDPWFSSLICALRYASAMSCTEQQATEVQLWSIIALDIYHLRSSSPAKDC